MWDKGSQTRRERLLMLIFPVSPRPRVTPDFVRTTLSAFRANREGHRSRRRHADFGAATQFGVVASGQHDAGNARARADDRADPCAFAAASDAAEYRAADRAAANVFNITFIRRAPADFILGIDLAAL